MKSIGFSAVAAPDARALILGTLPSVKSLEMGQYYAHPRNDFWKIMGALAGAPRDLAYGERLLQLQRCGIALWDVCQAAVRPGSSDAKIQLQTVEANDFISFLHDHPRIELICFNGQPAEKLFRRKVLPSLAALRPIPTQVLYSTSPAHAIAFEKKLACWTNCLAPYITGGS